VVLNDRDLEATYDLRATLESYGARQAAEVGNADIGGLRQMCAQMEAHLGRADNEAFEEITQLNQAFHQQIHSASGNVALPGLLSGLVQVALVRHTFDHYTPHELERSFAQHRELIDAIEARDGPWAAAVMSTHVLAARASLRRCLNTSTPPDQE
jgi:DNA-binding GntR family transcriptional regulator